MAKRRGSGEGCITKRKDGRWQGSILIGYDLETGRPKRKYFYGRTRKEAVSYTHLDVYKRQY